MNKLFILFFALILFLSIPARTYAYQIEYESVNPSSGITYTLKRFTEKFWLRIYSINSNHKSIYMEKLVDRRLAELKFTVDNKQIAHIQKASQRYSTSVGELTEFIIESNLDNRKAQIIKKLNSHAPLILKFRDTYDYRSAEWRFVEYDLDYINTYVAQLQG